MACLIVQPPAGGPPASQRMYLNATFTPTTSASRITGMVADAAFPLTNLVSNQLVVDRAGLINISAAIKASIGFTATVTGWVYLNGASVATGSTSSTGTPITLTASGIAVAAGDVLDLEVSTSSTFNVSITSGSTNTFLQFDPA